MSRVVDRAQHSWCQCWTYSPLAVRDLQRFALVTDDAHTLYEQFGFRPLDDVAKWMQRRR